MGGSCASPSFPCEVVASRDAFSSRSGSEPYAPDAVLPDVTHHGNFVSASLDQCRPISLFPRGEDAELCSPDAVEASRLPPVPPSPCLTSSLVCFCITCQTFFLSERKPASAPCAARISRTARPPSRTRPQTRTRPHRVRRSPALTPRARPQACTRPHRPHPPRIRFSTIFPQSFPQFRRFSTVAFFPLGFL